MKIKAIRNYMHNHKIARTGDEFIVDDAEGAMLVEKGFAMRLDEQQVVAEQIGLESPSFGNNDVPIKSGPKRGRPKKNAA